MDLRLLLLWFACAGLVFLILFFIPVPYGRHTRPGWGPAIPHRIAWSVMEGTAGIVFLCWFVQGRRFDPVSVLFLVLWEIHYINRAALLPRLMRGEIRRMPVLIAGLGVLFNVINATWNGKYLFIWSAGHGVEWLLDARFIIGILLFLIGFAANVQSDRILRRLRKKGETGYRIPEGGFFRWVSCPNYLAETIEWTGWSVLTWSWTGVAFVVWSFANLVPRAWAHHQWYRKMFPDYPPRRRALIPWIW